VTFKDNFSVQAADYAKFRPRYPDALFAYLAGLCANRQTAWDCGTGNGQCAVPLAKYFSSVIATDPSEKQLAQAESDPRVEYQRGSAEASELPADSMDLITVAQALHWFQIDRFWEEAKRILHRDGVIAVWCYEFLEVAPDIDGVVKHFYADVVGDYWDFERKLVEDGYRSVSFPFPELDPPPFTIQASWSLARLIGYLQSWSATQKFIAQNGTNPVQLIEADLNAAWGDPKSSRKVKWPLSLRIGRNV
jgi:SAM-dependent methyltransferase